MAEERGRDAGRFHSLLSKLSEERIAAMLRDSGILASCHRTTIRNWRIEAEKLDKAGQKVTIPRHIEVFDFLEARFEEGLETFTVIHGMTGLALTSRLISLSEEHLKHKNVGFFLHECYEPFDPDRTTKAGERKKRLPWLLATHGIKVNFVLRKLGTDSLDALMEAGPGYSPETSICLASRDAYTLEHKQSGIVRVCEIGRAKIPALYAEKRLKLISLDSLVGIAIGCPPGGLYQKRVEEILKEFVYTENSNPGYEYYIRPYSSREAALEALKSEKIDLIVGPPNWVRLNENDPRISLGKVYEGDIFGKTDYNIYTNQNKCNVKFVRKFIHCLNLVSSPTGVWEHAQHAKYAEYSDSGEKVRGLHEITAIGRNDKEARGLIEKDTKFEVCNVDLDVILALWAREGDLVL